MNRRRGPGLVNTMARTAVIAGTATAVSNSVSSKQHQKAQAQANQAQSAQQLADMQAQMSAMEAQQAAAAMPAPAVQPGSDLINQLTQLGELKGAGILTEEEFQAAKAKLLAG